MSLRDLLRRRRKRPLRALQVEITSRCTRRCAICPRTPLQDEWQEGDLTSSLWRILVQDLDLAEHVHLQGWGEPLLHPALPDWARDARQAGCTVGITTNGDLLAGAADDWLLKGDVDKVVISLAGNSAQHRVLRDGSCLETLLEVGGRLNHQARRLGLRLRIAGSYLLTRSNAVDLPQVVRLSARAGLHELFVVHLDCRSSRFQLQQCAFTGDNLAEGSLAEGGLAEGGLAEGIASLLDEAEEVGRECGIRYRGPAREAEELVVCSQDPECFVFVGWDGRVAPCVNMLLPGVGVLPRWTEEGAIQIAPFWYGSLQDATLKDLLDGAARQRFMATFRNRRQAEQRFLSTVMTGLDNGLCKVEEADANRMVALAQNPFPESCSACPKSRGW
jgi:MoaA/NifB/PqqE/SkfB family radical SAM enzyme